MPLPVLFYLLALTTILAVAAAATLFWPIPIHGGFTFLGEVAWHEWQSSRRLEEAAAAQPVAARCWCGRPDRPWYFRANTFT